MNAAITTYSGGGLQSVNGTEGVLRDVGVLPASKLLVKGTVLGQILGTGTDVNEVQTITGGGTISGGTYVIVYDGEMTSALAFNAVAATIQAALELLPSIGTGGITVTGGPLNTTPVVLTFAGSGTTAGKHHPLVSVINSLTGTTPTATPSLTTLGKPAGGYWDAYNDAASGSEAGLAVARRLLEYDCRSDAQARVFYGTEKGGGDHGHFDRAASMLLAGSFKTADLTGLDAAAVADLGRLTSGTTATLSASGTVLRMG